MMVYMRCEYMKLYEIVGEWSIGKGLDE